MTGTPEQLIRICALHEARLEGERALARRERRRDTLRDALFAALPLMAVATVIGFYVL